jgi:AmmeMemoRadiSam system protein B/AmmeMemoRadiSam system protein A
MQRDISPRRLIALLLGCLLAVSANAGERVRESVLAGTWYPSDPTELASYVDGLLDGVVAEPPQEPVRALIVPHAGYVYSGETAAEVFARVRGRAYRRVLVLAPSHRVGFEGVSIADVDAYETPLGMVPLDTRAIAGLRKSPLVISEAAAHAREHAIEIELPMLQRALAPGWKLLPVLVGEIARDQYPMLAELLRPLADAETLVVVSSDFTHYGLRFGYLPFPPDEAAPERIRALDEGAVERILAHDGPGLLDYQTETGITICGYRPLALFLHMLPADARVQRVAYTTSGELTGDWSHSVSYEGLLVTGPRPFSEDADARLDAGPTDRALSPADFLILHRLAVLGVERAVLGRSEARDAETRGVLSALPAKLRAPAGAFVTLKQGGHLRGCIGYVLPRKPLYQAVLENGLNAAANDWRFPPVRPDELGNLEVEVNVLAPPRAVDSYEHFLVGEHGIVLRKDGRQALFLPDVAVEQGWTREETLSRLARKAGLAEDAWREGASLEIFSSRKYSAPYALRAERPAASPSSLAQPASGTSGEPP